MRQQTLKKEAAFSGIALHTGARANIRLCPGAPDSGVVFKRVDMPGAPEVRACVQNVVDVRRGTTIGASNGASVNTVEHVLAALHAAGVDNALAEMDGPEPPIADGSASAYVKMIADAGVEEQPAEARVWRGTDTVTLEEGGVVMAVMPADRLKITCAVSFGATSMDTQLHTFTLTPEGFAAEIAPARTFVVYNELRQLLSMGLCKGGSLDNAMIMHSGAVICKEGLRFKNEFARHKILDIVGDLYLAGMRVAAHVVAVRPGHSSNVKLVGKMLGVSAK
jgi:UDP-3-O-acyl N-acetylglucosamine deacetylase